MPALSTNPKCRISVRVDEWAPRLTTCPEQSKYGVRFLYAMPFREQIAELLLAYRAEGSWTAVLGNVAERANRYLA
jgi:hypothetical protein